MNIEEEKDSCMTIRSNLFDERMSFMDKVSSNCDANLKLIRQYTKPIRPNIEVGKVEDGVMMLAKDGRKWIAKTIHMKGGKTRRVWVRFQIEFEFISLADVKNFEEDSPGFSKRMLLVASDIKKVFTSKSKMYVGYKKFIGLW
jgi:hypothetical protein